MRKYVPTALILTVLIFAVIGISAPSKYPQAVPSPTPTVAETPKPAPKPSPVPTPSPTPSPGEEIAAYALSFVGYPYKYGEESPEKGFDCSGLVFHVYEHFGYPLYRVASDMHKNGKLIEKKEDLQPGDILLFKRGYWIYHAGIYIGNNSFVHACDASTGVIVTSLDDYSDRGLEIRRMVGTMEPFSQEPLIAPQ